MEPGHEDREYANHLLWQTVPERPQWSPVMKTGNTRAGTGLALTEKGPQWSPVMKTGNTWDKNAATRYFTMPQWSPVMKTGNTTGWS